MINIHYQQEYNTVVIEFVGKVDAAQGKKYLADIPKVIPKHKQGFNLLVDISLLTDMDTQMKEPIANAMDLLNAEGVTKIIRVIPDTHKDIGLNIMSQFHYSDRVHTITLPSRKEAEERLTNEKVNRV